MVAPGVSVVPGPWGRATDIWGRAAGRCFSQSQPAVVTAIFEKPKGIDSGTHGIAAHARHAHKIKVDAGLVTLKRTVALVRHGLRRTARSVLEHMFDDFTWSTAGFSACNRGTCAWKRRWVA